MKDKRGKFWSYFVSVAIDNVCREVAYLTHLSLFIEGPVFSKVAVSTVGDGIQGLMKELALYLALCGPSWNGIPPNGWVDAWTFLSARGRCHLNALLGRLDPQDLVDVYTRGQRILSSVGQTQSNMVLWIRTLRRLVKVGYAFSYWVFWFV